METKLYKALEYEKIVNDLLEGKVVGFPTDTVYGLAIVYDDKEAFDKLYEIKNRSITKPISMMVYSKGNLKDVAIIDENSLKVIDKCMPGDLTIILKAKDNLPVHVTFNQKTIGVRIPTNEVALNILKKVNKPLLVTSANLSNEPSLIKSNDVYNTFNGKISSLIDEDAKGKKASSVVSVYDKVVMYRQGNITIEQIEKIIKEKNMKKKISIACDHGGLQLKNAIIKHFKRKYEFIDCGTYTDLSCDYPDFAFKACELVRDNKVDFGIVICKSGIGMSIAANKVKGVRCALVDNVTNATLCHQHNNANVIAMGSNDVSNRKAYKIIEAYDEAVFEERHQRRIDKISNYER